jgi:hypothetical protein
VFEQSLISFVERLMHKTESLLIDVSGNALKLKMMTGNELEKSIEALDLTCNRQSGVASSVSCNDFLYCFERTKRFRQMQAGTSASKAWSRLWSKLPSYDPSTDFQVLKVVVESFKDEADAGGAR